MNKNLTPIASAVAMLMFSLAAQAQQAVQPTDPDQSQQVVVTGIRASLQSAINIKRNSDAVVDALSAEDIGKLPDDDVGEALGRIAGVSVGREFGQGSSVSVRGLDPQMTYTTLNGQTIASTGWYDQKSIDRSFNYSLLPADLIGGIDVYKTSQADLTEGGIGGTVIVKSRKPLDMPANSGFLSADYGKGTVSTDPSKGAAGLYSWKNEEKTFGVLIAGSVDKGNYIRRGVESDTVWSMDVEPTTFVQDRQTSALNIDLQAKPTRELDVDLNYLSLTQHADNSNTSLYFFQQGFCTSQNAAGVCTTSNTPAGQAQSTYNPTFMQTWARAAEMDSNTLTLNGHYKGNGFRVDGVINTTKADGGTSETTNYSYYNGWGPLSATNPYPNVQSNLPTFTGSVNATGHQIQISPTSNMNVPLSDLPAMEGPQGAWATSKGPNEDKENSFQTDLTLDLDSYGLTSFKTGIRYSEHTFTKSTYQGDFNATTTLVPTASLYSGTMSLGTPGWTVPQPNIGAMMANTNANINGWTQERSGYGKLQEDNTALYGMFEFAQDKFHGNFGLRYIGTSVTGTSYAFDGTNIPGDIGANDGWDTNLVSQSSSYHYVLPSLNVAYDVDRNTIARFAASQTMTRPNFDNMFLVNEAGYEDNVNDQAVTYGSVALKPMISTNLDLSLEYYYGKGNMLSATYYHKNLNNFITTETEINQQIGITAPNVLPNPIDNWTINRYVNAGGGRVDGLELQADHAWDNGFGVAANFTLINAVAPASSYTDEQPQFTQSSKDNANVVTYWENSQFFVRLAYNYRSAYMIRETGYYGNRMQAGYGELDASAGWNITKDLKLMLSAQNLNKANDVEYGVAPDGAKVSSPAQELGYPAWSFMGETTYKATLSYKF
jgi:iron complex outermembrane receptor protein